jgi:hypothetical protein
MSSNGGVPYAPRDAARGTDIYENECVRIVDDCIEPEAAAVNWRVWNNKIHQTTVAVSAAPIHWGPFFFFRNQMFNIGASGGGMECCNSRKRVGTAALMKGGGLNQLTAHVRPILYWLHNSFWTNVDGSGIPNNADVGTVGLDSTINGQSNYNAVQYVRNNIIRNTAYTSRIGQFDTNTNWDEDYNIFVSRPTKDYLPSGTRSSGMRIEGGINGHQHYDSQLANQNQVIPGTTLWSLTQYRADLTTVAGRPGRYGNGEHSNKIGPNKTDVAFTGAANGTGSVAVLDALLVSPVTGNLSLQSGNNPLVDAGIPIPNISDCFAGEAPDLGAIEQGSITRCTSPASSPSASVSSGVSATPVASSFGKVGDIDGNGKVDIFDYNILLTNFGKSGSAIQGDLDSNGKVDIFDYNSFLTNYGK